MTIKYCLFTLVHRSVLMIMLNKNCRFKWVHLAERLAYERAVRKQRLRTEIAQAKREANFFAQNIDMSKKLKKKAQQGEISDDFKAPEIKQRETDQEIRAKKMETEKPEDRTNFLRDLFG